MSSLATSQQLLPLSSDLAGEPTMARRYLSVDYGVHGPMGRPIAEGTARRIHCHVSQTEDSRTLCVVCSTES